MQPRPRCDLVRIVVDGKNPGATTQDSAMTREPRILPPDRTAIDAPRATRDAIRPVTRPALVTV
jgi:hypothetical protein